MSYAFSGPQPSRRVPPAARPSRPGGLISAQADAPSGSSARARPLPVVGTSFTTASADPPTRVVRERPVAAVLDNVATASASPSPGSRGIRERRPTIESQVTSAVAAPSGPGLPLVQSLSPPGSPPLQAQPGVTVADNASDLQITAAPTLVSPPANAEGPLVISPDSLPPWVYEVGPGSPAGGGLPVNPNYPGPAHAPVMVNPNAPSLSDPGDLLSVTPMTNPPVYVPGEGHTSELELLAESYPEEPYPGAGYTGGVAPTVSWAGESGEGHNPEIFSEAAERITELYAAPGRPHYAAPLETAPPQQPSHPAVWDLASPSPAAEVAPTPTISIWSTTEGKILMGLAAAAAVGGAFWWVKKREAEA